MNPYVKIGVWALSFIAVSIYGTFKSKKEDVASEDNKLVDKLVEKTKEAKKLKLPTEKIEL